MIRPSSRSPIPPVHERDATCSLTNARTVYLYVCNRESTGYGH